MDAAEIQRCREILAELRRQAANAQRDDIESLVNKVGYGLKPKKGGHPVYVKAGRLPITIPGHRNKMNKNTVGGILDRIEADIDREEEELKRGD